MDIEILFTALLNENWKMYSDSGRYEPEELESEGAIICADGNNINEYLNSRFSDQNKILVLVLDPLRIQSPMKRVKTEGHDLVELTEAFSLDAIIDKITVGKDQDDQFKLSVRHFD
ncbi:DUF952 domain-containing protein [Balneola sp. MJW-20]|uniref:DUF952 domain-containing protein n=1 Tax=Gracilimonas aurantiaca TaxID=3234185 RepID=UPI0034654EE6